MLPYYTFKPSPKTAKRTWTISRFDDFMNTIIDATDFNNSKDVKECRDILNSLQDDVVKSIHRIISEHDSLKKAYESKGIDY
jgi:hypothetical protein